MSNQSSANYSSKVFENARKVLKLVINVNLKKTIVNSDRSKTAKITKIGNIQHHIDI